MAGTEDPPEDLKDQDPPEGEDQDLKDQDPPEGEDQDLKDQDAGKKDQDPEVKKALARRDRALARAQKAEEDAKALRDKYEPEKADPVKVANRRLVTAEAKVVMTAAGITEKEDQRELASFLDLDSVVVTDDGDVDSDTIQERLEKLARIVGKAKGKDHKRIPRVDTRDRAGEKAAPKDSQSARRRSMLGYR